jgi:ER degradation enhancer, mannosidase alpha-like 1
VLNLYLQSYEFVLSVNGTAVPEDPNPSPFKLRKIEGGYVVQNLTGLRVRIVSLVDGRSFNIVESERTFNFFC